MPRTSSTRADEASASGRGETKPRTGTSSPRPQRRACNRSTRCRRWFLTTPVEEPPLPAGAELRRLTSAEQAEDYWRIAAASYASIGFPPEVFAGYTDHAGCSPRTSSPSSPTSTASRSSIAMTIVSHGVAGIYWVGSLEQARGKGSAGRRRRRRPTPASSWAPTSPPCRHRRWASRSTKRWATRRSSTTGSSCHRRPERRPGNKHRGLTGQSTSAAFHVASRGRLSRTDKESAD